MASRTINALLKVGIIAEEMAPPRQMVGIVKIIFSIVAVAYAYFFIHVAFFGPPVEAIFRGTFFLGVALMSLLLFKNRQRPIHDRTVWLDELFALANLFMLCGAIAVWLHWQIGENEVKWFRYFDGEVLLVGTIGGLVGAGIYVFEGLRPRRKDGFSISDILYAVCIVVSVLWWVENVEELRLSSGRAVHVLLFVYSVMMVAVSFEIARRIVGPLIPLIGFLFFIYSFELVAEAMPGILNYPGYDAETVMEFLMASTEGMFGLITNVFATLIVIFVACLSGLHPHPLGLEWAQTGYRGARHGCSRPRRSPIPAFATRVPATFPR